MNIFKIIIGTNTEGYDLDKDQIGDVPFHPLSLYSVLSEQNPMIMLFTELFRGDIRPFRTAIPSLTPEILWMRAR